MDNERNPRHADPILTVPGLLNVLYRGRLVILGLTLVGLAAGIAYGIIVKPLYRATAQVRPGVVSYNPDGFPNREWALEDVTEWFSGFLYWRDLKEQPEFEEAKAPPVIDATFIPSLNFVAGGNVITLTNLARRPELAAITLDRAITVFNRQARADSMGSSLHLTVRRGQAAIRRLEREIEQVDTKAERVKLDIAERERQLSLIDLREKELDLDLQTREADIVWMRQAVTGARANVEDARRRLSAAEEMLAVAVAAEKNGDRTAPAGGDAVTEVLKQTAKREQAGRVGELLLTVNDLGDYILAQSVKSDSLEARIKSNELEIGRIRLLQEIELAKLRDDVHQQISDLNLKLSQDLPYEREVLRAGLADERIKIDLISPLERVGEISVTDKPVRPRKLRAAAILTILAFFGSVCLVLVGDYLRNNRAAITAARNKS